MNPNHYVFGGEKKHPNHRWYDRWREIMVGIGIDAYKKRGLTYYSLRATPTPRNRGERGVSPMHTVLRGQAERSMRPYSTYSCGAAGRTRNLLERAQQWAGS